MPQPPRRICGPCGLEDDVSAVVDPSGTEWIYTCTNHSPEPYSWVVPIPTTRKSGSSGSGGGVKNEGITARLNVYDDLLACIHPGEPWLEYGIIEHRYKVVAPETYFGELIEVFGHRAIEPSTTTVSAFLARTLMTLSNRGHLQRTWGPATGYWAYDDTVSYWARPPVPPESKRLTWVSFAEQNGMDPQTWDMTSTQLN